MTFESLQLTKIYVVRFLDRGSMYGCHDPTGRYPVKNRASPSGLPGSLPASLFIEKETVNLTPQESRVREPEDSIPIQTLETVTVSESPQSNSTAISGQEEKSAHPVCVAPGGMKSPCTSAFSVYQNRETMQERDQWLEAIARDNRREKRNG